MEGISEEMWTKDVTWNHMDTVGVLSGLPGQTSLDFDRRGWRNN